MKLTYRGVSYEYTPPTIETTEGELAGKYRGLDWRFCNLKKAPVQQATVELMYRGVAYGSAEQAPTVPVRQPIAVPSVAPAVSASLFEDKARSLMMSNCRAIKKRQQSMLSRLASEVGLAGDVSGYWNRIQGKVHPTFRLSYDRSRAAMS
jgi:hypothetical protein